MSLCGVNFNKKFIEALKKRADDEHPLLDEQR